MPRSLLINRLDGIYPINRFVCHFFPDSFLPLLYLLFLLLLLILLLLLLIFVSCSLRIINGSLLPCNEKKEILHWEANKIHNTQTMAVVRDPLLAHFENASAIVAIDAALFCCCCCCCCHFSRNSQYVFKIISNLMIWQSIHVTCTAMSIRNRANCRICQFCCSCFCWCWRKRQRALKQSHIHFRM